MVNIYVISFLFLQALLLNFPSIIIGGPVPDTGQYKCYDDSTQIPCPQPGESYYGQDAQYEGFSRSYTKLGQNGVELPDTATEFDGWIMTRDNVTGLIWEMKNDDGGTHDETMVYRWSEGQSVFVPLINQLNFGGFSDWRIPTIKELNTLITNSYPGMDFDFIRFPQNGVGYTWSSTSYAQFPTMQAWRISNPPYGGTIFYDGMSASFQVIAVRDSAVSLGSLIDNGNGTITDLGTGLMWQKATPSHDSTWQEALQYAESLNLGGYTDWRLPNRNELQTIVDYTRYNPAINPLFESNQWFLSYWSSTTVDNDPISQHPDRAWTIWFERGTFGSSAKYSGLSVRAVRTIQEKPKTIPWIPLLLLDD